MQRIACAVLVCAGLWAGAALADRLVAGPLERDAGVQRATADALPGPVDGAWQASPEAVTVLAAGASWVSADVHAVLAGAPRHHDAVPAPAPASALRAAPLPVSPPSLRDIPLLI